MVLYLIGLGLGDEEDITMKGLKLVRSADLVFLESYTSILPTIDKTKLEALYGGKPITVADRHLIESDVETQILEPARSGQKVALLVVGDPFCATTHTDLYLRCRELGIEVVVVHNASIMGTAAGACGLQAYKFGQTVSIPYFDGGWKPTSFYEKIRYNRLGGLHTLCLLDIKVKEPDYEALMRGGSSKNTTYLPPRFMTVQQAAAQLLETLELIAKEETQAEDVEGGEDGHDVNGDIKDAAEAGPASRPAASSPVPPAYDGAKTLCIGLARIGHESCRIVAGTLKELASKEQEVVMGPPLHSLIICGQLHDLEMDMIRPCLLPHSSYQLST